jgi:hypothetical protein
VNRLTLLSAFLALLSAAGCDAVQDGRADRAAGEAKSVVNTDEAGLALQGYDPVAFFTQAKPVKGDPAITAVHRRATYRFASAEHKRLFEADPAKYEPQFGGYCGYGASQDKLAPIQVEYFQVLDGRLVLQHNRKAWDLWNQDVAGNLKRADANWPGLVARHGR